MFKGVALNYGFDKVIVSTEMILIEVDMLAL